MLFLVIPYCKQTFLLKEYLVMYSNEVDYINQKFIILIFLSFEEKYIYLKQNVLLARYERHDKKDLYCR